MNLLAAYEEFERNVVPPEWSSLQRGKVKLAFYLGCSEIIDRFAQVSPPYTDFLIAVNLQLAQIATSISQGLE